MNIPDKKTDLKDNRNARSFLKTRIQTESAGFFNGLLKIFFIFFVPAVGILSARMLKRIIIRQLQWEGEYIRQIRNLEDYGVPAIFEKTDRYKNPFEGKGFIASEISLFCELLTWGWITIAFVLFIYMV